MASLSTLPNLTNVETRFTRKIKKGSMQPTLRMLMQTDGKRNRFPFLFHHNITYICPCQQDFSRKKGKRHATATMLTQRRGNKTASLFCSTIISRIFALVNKIFYIKKENRVTRSSLPAQGATKNRFPFLQ
jgi:hypothetical protein